MQPRAYRSSVPTKDATQNVATVLPAFGVRRKFRVPLLAVCAALLAACGGGGGGSDDNGGNSQPTATAPDKPIVYIAVNSSGTRELFLVDADAPGVAAKVNPPLVAGGNVGSYALSPDLRQVSYIADQDTDNVFELYLVDLATPGTATRLNSTLVQNGAVEEFAFSPDGASIAYVADQDVAGRSELYLVALANPRVSTKLNSALGADRDVAAGHSCSPDGTKVLYAADQEVDGRFELYLVDLAVPGVSTKVNEPFVAGGEISAQSYRFAPDSSFVVYRADQDTDEVFELYRVDVTSPGNTEKINDTLTAGGDIPPANRTPAFRISPNSSTVTYIADQDTDNRFEVYAVDLATPGAALKLNPPVQSFGIAQIDITADGSQIVYHALQDSATVPELYRVALASPGVSTKINGALAANGAAIDFSIAPGLRTP